MRWITMLTITLSFVAFGCSSDRQPSAEKIQEIIRKAEQQPVVSDRARERIINQAEANSAGKADSSK